MRANVDLWREVLDPTRTETSTSRPKQVTNVAMFVRSLSDEDLGADDDLTIRPGKQFLFPLLERSQHPKNEAKERSRAARFRSATDQTVGQR